MQQHMSYLLTLPNIVPVLGRMQQLISIRTKTYDRLSNLEGKLDLILSQIFIKENPVDDEISQEAIVVYQEDSSDDEDGFSFSDDDDSENKDGDWDKDFDFTDEAGEEEEPKTNGPTTNGVDGSDDEIMDED